MPTRNKGRCGKRYRGVQFRRWGKWVAEIRCGRRSRMSLGSYFTPEAAARAYDAALLLLRRPNSLSQVNFPDSVYALPNEITSSNLSPKSIRKAAAAVGSAFDRVPINASAMSSDKVTSPVLPQEVEASTRYRPNCSPDPVAGLPLHGVHCGKEAMEVRGNINEFDTNFIDSALLPSLPNCCPDPVAGLPLHGAHCGKEAMEVQENINEFETNFIDSALLPSLPTELLDEDPLGFLTDIPADELMS